MLNRSKLWAAGLLVAAFAAGAAVGGAVTAARGADDQPTASDRDRSGDRRRGRTSYGERLQESLSLTVAQRESVDVILARRQAAVDTLWAKVRPEFKAMWDDVRRDIMQVLNEDQQNAYQALLARSDSIRAARERRDHKEKSDGK